MKVNLYPEICCDFCNSVIHNHFDCPVCNKGYEPTSMYYDLSFRDEDIDFECETCHTQFKIIKNSYNEMEIEEL